MRQLEEQYIEHEVKTTLMPEIKKLIPGVLGWILSTIFPKMEAKLIEGIKQICQMVLDWQQMIKDDERN